jgi:hypothetical protein
MLETLCEGIIFRALMGFGNHATQLEDYRL